MVAERELLKSQSRRWNVGVTLKFHLFPLNGNHSKNCRIYCDKLSAGPTLTHERHNSIFIHSTASTGNFHLHRNLWNWWWRGSDWNTFPHSPFSTTITVNPNVRTVISARTNKKSQIRQQNLIANTRAVDLVSSCNCTMHVKCHAGMWHYNGINDSVDEMWKNVWPIIIRR